jgi:hypothetical protein
MPRSGKLSSIPWHPGYRFAKRPGRGRKIRALLTLAGLVTLIGGYWYVTDSGRVRDYAQRALSEAIGGPVTIGRARLSIFEGLRLYDVRVFVDNKNLPDSQFFYAQSLQVSFPIAQLVRGDLSGATILAVEPRLLLASDADGGRWNLHRLRSGPATTRPKPAEPFRLALPRVLLRNATITYAEVKGGRLIPQPSHAVEGALDPDPAMPDRYFFNLTALGPTDQSGPSVTGWMQLGAGQFSARLKDFDLAADTLGFLPAQVRDWWRRHGITGKIEIPDLFVEPPPEGETRWKFRILCRFTDGALSIRPEEITALTKTTVAPGLPPIQFQSIRGQVLFTDSGIELSDLSLLHEDNRIRVSGSLSGYSPDSPISLRIACDDLNIPAHPAIVPSLPAEAREVYDRFLPRGQAAFSVSISRDKDSEPVINGRIDIKRGFMRFERFTYPCHDITGAVIIASEGPGRTRLTLENVEGRGVPGSANADARMRVNGTMFPLEHGSEVDFIVSGEKLVADDELVAAMPPGVRKALAEFAQPGRTHLDFTGSFKAAIYRFPGYPSRWRWPIDITISDGAGRYREFPYPLTGLNGEVRIRSGYVEFADLGARRALADGSTAVLGVSGKVHYGDDVPNGKLRYELTLAGSNLPVDEALLGAIPDGRREWIDRLGISGLLAVAGSVTGLDGAYNLDIRLTDGQLAPQLAAGGPGKWTATDLGGQLKLDKTSLTVVSARANRGGGTVSASGQIVFGKPGVEGTGVSLDVAAASLPLEPELCDVLPPIVQTAWTAIRPEGSADISLALRPDKPVHVVVTPLGLAATPEILPVRFTDVSGKVVVDGERVSLQAITARRGNSTVAIAGNGLAHTGGQWDLVVSARGAVLDAELRDAFPPALRDTLVGLNAAGVSDVELRRLTFTPGDKTASPAVGASADFDVRLRPTDLTLSLGVPMRVTDGDIELRGTIRDDRIQTLDGGFTLRHADLGGRPLTNASATLSKTSGQPGLKLDNIGGTLADGEIVGRAAIAFPDGSPTRYALDLTLRNADVQVLAGKQVQQVSGRLSASLAVEGAVDSPFTRRGRGDITVSGDRMARIPVLLNLVQVANLSLPGGTSFNNASARYSLDGARINFEQLAIRSPGFEMAGKGRIDLESRDVRFTFWTARPDLLNIPVLSDLADRARRELLQITVKGTIDRPIVGASAFDSFTTTVEEVLRSSEPPPRSTPTPTPATTRTK